MPIYFFHITEGEEIIPDLEGIEQPDLAAVQVVAVTSASDLIADAVKRGERNYQGRFDVEDEQGRRVLTLKFACPIQFETTVPLPEAVRPQAEVEDGDRPW